MKPTLCHLQAKIVLVLDVSWKEQLLWYSTVRNWWYVEIFMQAYEYFDTTKRKLEEEKWLQYKYFGCTINWRIPLGFP
jgi:hypothetical protein